MLMPNLNKLLITIVTYFTVICTFFLAHLTQRVMHVFVITCRPSVVKLFIFQSSPLKLLGLLQPSVSGKMLRRSATTSRFVVICQ